MKLSRNYIIFTILIVVLALILPVDVMSDIVKKKTDIVSIRGRKTAKNNNDTITDSIKKDSAVVLLPEVDKIVADTLAKDSVKTIVADSLMIDSLTVATDTLSKNTLKQASVSLKKDTISNDTVAKPKFILEKVDLDNIVNFNAKDSLIFYGRDKAFMYGKSSVNYGEINLSAAEIRMNMNNSYVHALGAKDSVGDLYDNPIFKDPSGEYESKTMKYNFKSKKGYITDVITEQGEGFLTGGITKKMENDEYYIKDGRYTTCSDHENPHFYFQITKGKVKPKKNIVTGPAYMVLADVPLPIAVPFGYFPFTSKYSSGIIFPTIGEDYNRGFYLRDGGYYFAINDNIDLALTGEIYTKGSWGINARSNYVKRYKFSGNFDLSFLKTIEGDKGQPDYSQMKNFKIAWSHTQDSKSNPNLSFSASVNFTTSGYTRNDLNSYYNSSFTENTKSSTINMTYRIPNSKWNISATANVSQRTADSTLSVSFPNLTVTHSQFAPFKRKKTVGSEKWYEKIKMSYTGYFQNSLTAQQDVFFKKSLIKDWKNGMKHNIPISATFNVFKYLNITPNIVFNDRMYTSKIRKAWDPNASAEVAVDTTYNFYNVFDFQGSISLDTKIYGFYKPMKFLGDKVQMIRHVFTPSVSFSASPDFSSPGWGYYGAYQYTQNGKQYHRKYSYFQHGVFGSVGQGKTGTLSWAFANNLEMKVKSDADSSGVKKISLIENLTISQSYNFAADSMRWSNINANILLRLVKNFNLSLNTTWDVYTYKLNSAGNPVRVDIPRWKAGKGLAKLSSTGTSFSYTFNNDTFRKKSKSSKDKGKKSSSSESFDNDDGSSEDDKNDKKDDSYDLTPDGYVKWNCPWSLTLNYSVNYGYGSFNKEKLEYNGRWTQNLSLSGSIRPTKNWNFNFSASYNFDTGKIAYMNCTISRDLHCFSMSASFVPVGPYKSYNFHIAVKSAMLSDLKYDKRSSMRNGVDWY